MRGSTPAPGPEFVRYGGNTSCVAVAHDGDAAPTLVLDAGTGLHNLSLALDGAPFRGTIVLGHLHWDHTHGLPFFSAGDRPDAEVRLLIPRPYPTGQDEDGAAAHDVLARAMSPPHFPIIPSQLRGSWTFGAIDPGPHELEGFEVAVREIPHGGGRTFGYRVSDGRAAIAYLSDHSPIRYGKGDDGLGAFHDDALALADGVDLLVHDSQFTAAEFPERAMYGHSAIEYAIGLARHAGARAVLLFHHDPRRTDDQIDALMATYGNGDLPVTAACEQMEIELPAGP